MKKLFVTAAVAALTTAAPAFASTLNINLSGVNATQTQNGNVAQRAASVAAAVGETGTSVDISSTAVDAVQMADVSVAIDQGAGAFVNGNALGSAVTQRVSGSVNQAGLSIAGSGDLGAGSTIASTMANIGQNAGMTVKVTQH